jgi:hypothetical protein
VEHGLVACPKHYFGDGAEAWGTGEDGNLIDRGDATLSDEEIGAIAGISAKNVSVKLVRIKQQLMQMSDNQEL